MRQQKEKKRSEPDPAPGKRDLGAPARTYVHGTDLVLVRRRAVTGYKKEYRFVDEPRDSPRLQLVSSPLAAAAEGQDFDPYVYVGHFSTSKTNLPARG